ncbi:ABC transporter permease subunit [Demequina sp.]|uniref:ABC transporter permease subunit n=1 Tax=Demequina sp. TaxID=2050685 RepID=UPI003D103106
MLRTVYLKSLRDHVIGVSIGVLSLFAVAWMGIWAYSGVDDADTYFASLPDAYVDLLGITRDSGTAGLMMSMMFGFMGAFVFGGLAISMGASAIAGEERDGTLDVLATVPRSRERLHASKAAAYLTLLVGGSILASASYYLAAAIVGADISSLDIAAATAHMTSVILVYGVLAFAIGAATGNRSLASGISTGFLVVSFLGAGLLPLVDGWENVAKVFPWYYIDGASPLVDGPDTLQLACLTAAWAVMLGVGGAAFARRDLHAGGATRSLADRLRANPRMASLMDKWRGSGSTRSLAAKALSDKQGVAMLGAYGLFFLTIVMGPMYNALADTIGDVVASMPDALLAMVGFADYSTPTGWYHGEVLSITGPAVFAIVTIGAGVALATEERWRTISVVLSAPVSRGRVAGGKLAALLELTLLCGVLLFGGIWLGSVIAGLGISVANIAAAATLQAGLGLVFGAAAFAVAGCTGNSKAAAWAGTGVALGGWALNTFVGVNDSLEWLARLSPFHWAVSNYPLDHGMNWGGLVALAVASGVLIVVGWLGYQRRDLRG